MTATARQPDVDAALDKLNETANRIADQRNDLLKEARANLFALENMLTFLRRHADVLPHYSASGLEVRIEKTRAAISRAEA